MALANLSQWTRKVRFAAARRKVAAGRSHRHLRPLPTAPALGAAAVKADPFRLDLPADRLWTRGPLGAVVERSLDAMLHLSEMDGIYRQVHALTDDRHFVDKVLQVLAIGPDISAQDLDRIPKTGPAIVVANHPFGAIEGLVLASVLRRVRPDAKVMANYMLSRLPELDDVMLYVDPFGKKESAARNLRSLRQAIEFVKGGGLLAIFPAGTVAHLQWQQRAVVDPPWTATLARLVHRTQAPVTPIYFRGANGPMFQLAGLVHPLLRTAMLPRELLNKRHHNLGMLVGNAIPYARLKTLEEDKPLVDYLRLRTYVLANRAASVEAKAQHAAAAAGREMEPIVDAVEPLTLQWEIDRLPADTLMVDAGDQRVYLATAAQAPHVLREIGRLREITFRLAGEGTGTRLDLDRYDPHYLHLFIWHRGKRQIVGAYRMGLTDRLLEQHGLDGLYTHELFGYSQKLLEQIGPALEMGRAFIRPEYQRSYSSLMLLWKGIGQFIARQPRYHCLLGPVSINNEYKSVSRELMIRFLRYFKLDAELARLLKPKNPPRPRGVRGGADLRDLSLVVRDIEDVSSIVSEIEEDHKGVPILMRQYLKLNARFLGFNVDPTFGDVTDGLVLVDLFDTDPRILEKYMGDTGLSKLREAHAAAK